MCDRRCDVFCRSQGPPVTPLARAAPPPASASPGAPAVLRQTQLPRRRPAHRDHGHACLSTAPQLEARPPRQAHVDAHRHAGRRGHLPRRRSAARRRKTSKRSARHPVPGQPRTRRPGERRCSQRDLSSPPRPTPRAWPSATTSNTSAHGGDTPLAASVAPAISPARMSATKSVRTSPGGRSAWAHRARSSPPGWPPRAPRQHPRSEVQGNGDRHLPAFPSSSAHGQPGGIYTQDFGVIIAG